MALAPLSQALAADEAFIHRGWKGYALGADEMGGCRMSKHVTGKMHLVAHVTAQGTFLLGFVDGNMNVPTGRNFDRHANFDGVHFALSGSADNPKLVTFGTEEPGIEETFRSSHVLHMNWNGGGWLTMPLRGSRRASELLRRCAVRRAPRQDYVTSYAPRVQSGPGDRTFFDTDLPGNDYMYLDRLSQGQCVSACRDQRMCRAVTYNLAKRRCFLKHKAGRTLRFYGATSWVK